MSAAHRFFAENVNYPAESEISLTGEEFAHAKTVLRVEEGEEIVLLDGSGKEYSAIVTKIEKRGLSAHILGATECGREPISSITLVCGFLKNADKNEIIVQKAVELGVERIIFFTSKFSSAYMNENKLERLNRVSKEAAKQCLRARAPKVEYFNFNEALKEIQGCKSKLFACEFLKDGESGFAEILSPAAIIIGSEGGFSNEEFEYARSLGCKGITLGRRILRAETAAISALTLAAYFLGELK